MFARYEKWETIEENGIYDKNRLGDGDHRIIIAKKLGIKKVICKVWKPV